MKDEKLSLTIKIVDEHNLLDYAETTVVPHTYNCGLCGCSGQLWRPTDDYSKEAVLSCYMDTLGQRSNHNNFAPAIPRPDNNGYFPFNKAPKEASIYWNKLPILGVIVSKPQ